MRWSRKPTWAVCLISRTNQGYQSITKWLAYGLDDRETAVQLPVAGKDFFRLQSDQTGYPDQPASCPLVDWSFFVGGKAVRARSRAINFIRGALRKFGSGELHRSSFLQVQEVFIHGLTSWSRVILQKQRVTQTVNTFPDEHFVEPFSSSVSSKSPHLESILGHVNPLHTFTSFLIKTHFNIIY